MSERVADVVCTDTGRDISDLVNRLSAHPVAFVGLMLAESGLRERAAREAGNCDVSFGLCQQSVCYLTTKPLGWIESLPPTHPLNVAAAREWYSNAEHAIADAAPRFDRLYSTVEATIGRDHPNGPLLACCWWNAPNLGGTDRHASASMWLRGDLATVDPKHAANRENYRRALGAAEHYRAKEVPMPTTQAFAVGQGVKDAMARNNDQPKGNEAYISASYSLTPGEKWAYLYSAEANQVYKLPLA